MYRYVIRFSVEQVIILTLFANNVKQTMHVQVMIIDMHVMLLIYFLITCHSSNTRGIAIVDVMIGQIDTGFWTEFVVADVL